MKSWTLRWWIIIVCFVGIGIINFLQLWSMITRSISTSWTSSNEESAVVFQELIAVINDHDDHHDMVVVDDVNDEDRIEEQEEDKEQELVANSIVALDDNDDVETIEEDVLHHQNEENKAAPILLSQHDNDVGNDEDNNNDNNHEPNNDRVLWNSNYYKNMTDDDDDNDPIKQSHRHHQSVMFVHIGKAGGETLKDLFYVTCGLRGVEKRTICYQQFVPSNISYYVHSYLHGKRTVSSLYGPDHTTSAFGNTTSFLYNIRHPIDRMISWYSFAAPMNCHHTKTPTNLASCRSLIELKKYIQHRNDNTKIMKFVSDVPEMINDTIINPYIYHFFVECFPTIEDFAIITAHISIFTEYYLDSNTTNGTKWNATRSSYHNEKCFHLAKRLIYGRENNYRSTITTHATSNYKYYYQRTIQHQDDDDDHDGIHQNKSRANVRTIYAVRTNQLWDDIKSIDRYHFHGTGNFGTLEGGRISHGSEVYHPSTRTFVHPMSRTLLCCALRNDMYYYHKILYLAHNFNHTEKMNTMRYDYHYCHPNYYTWDDLLQDCDAISRIRYTIRNQKKDDPMTTFVT